MRSIPLIHTCARATIEYPCSWTFTVIGCELVSLREAVRHCIGSRDHTVENSRISTGGRYISLKVRLTVSSEAERLHLHHQLAAEQAVRVVL